jgi:hypothetical protein
MSIKEGVVKKSEWNMYPLGLKNKLEKGGDRPELGRDCRT